MESGLAFCYALFLLACVLAFVIERWPAPGWVLRLQIALIFVWIDITDWVHGLFSGT